MVFGDISWQFQLTDTQLMMLSAAAQRNDRYLVATPNLKVATAQKIASKLMGAALVREIRAKAGAPVWRRDNDAGLSYALRLTAAGANAVANDKSSEPGTQTTTATYERTSRWRARRQKSIRILILHRWGTSALRPRSHPLHEAGRSWRGSSNCFNRIAARASPS
jgi:hypothetical protein